MMGCTVGYLIMLIALSTLFVAIKRDRDADLGEGFRSNWPILKVMNQLGSA